MGISHANLGRYHEAARCYLQVMKGWGKGVCVCLDGVWWWRLLGVWICACCYLCRVGGRVCVRGWRDGGRIWGGVSVQCRGMSD